MTIKPLLTRPRQQHHLVIRLVTRLHSAQPPHILSSAEGE